MSDLQLSDQNPEKYIQVIKRGQFFSEIYLLLSPNKIYSQSYIIFKADCDYVYLCNKL